jgi:hypothetical protein
VGGSDDSPGFTCPTRARSGKRFAAGRRRDTSGSGGSMPPDAIASNRSHSYHLSPRPLPKNRMKRIPRRLFAVLVAISCAPSFAIAQSSGLGGRISVGLHSALLSFEPSRSVHTGFLTYGLGASVQARLSRRIAVGVSGETYQGTDHWTPRNPPGSPTVGSMTSRSGL